MATYLLLIHLQWQWLAAFDAARHVRVFSLDSFQLTATVPCLSSPPTAIGFSPSSDMLAIASANKQAIAVKLTLTPNPTLTPTLAQP